MGRTERYCMRIPLKILHKILRSERKFPSLEELREEIQKNAAETRKFFENA